MTKPLILICATDAGGARNLAVVAARNTRQAEFLVFGSALTKHVFGEYGVGSQLIDLHDIDGAVRLLEQLRPEAIICGRTRFVSSDRRLVGGSLRMGIPTVVVLDEWYLYSHAFLDEAGTASYLPDRICCQDEIARSEAIIEGVPAESLVITGSPALCELADRAQNFASDPPPLPDCWRDASGLRILFISENHAEEFGTGADKPGTLGSWLGYTERDVRTMLGQVQKESSAEFTVVEKLHPASANISLPPNARGHWRTVAAEPLWPIIWHADAVVGMRSMALLEAALMGYRPLSFQPNLQVADSCTAARFGLVDHASRRDELEAWLLAPPRRTAPNRPDFANAHAALNVFDVTTGLLTGATHDLRPLMRS